MSRILELQPTDEQTIVARVLLELHQAIDANFPDVNASTRQFTKTVLSHQSEQTAVDRQPQVANQPIVNNQVESHQNKNKLIQSKQPTGLEFSKAESSVKSMGATSFEEAGWSKWLTRILTVTLIAGLILFAWIYLFGI